jgi:hypothetical protein
MESLRNPKSAGHPSGLMPAFLIKPPLLVGLCGRPSLRAIASIVVAFRRPDHTRHVSRQGTRMRSAQPRSAGAELLSLPAMFSCTAGTQSYPVFAERPTQPNPSASNLSEGQHTTGPCGSSQSHACPNNLRANFSRLN